MITRIMRWLTRIYTRLWLRWQKRRGYEVVGPGDYVHTMESEQDKTP